MRRTLAGLLALAALVVGGTRAAVPAPFASKAYPFRTELDVREFGARCDDTADDATAIQAAIDVAGDASAVLRSGLKVVITGPCAIGATILLQRKSVTLEGRGWGLVSGSAPKSYLRWIGAAAQPMIRVQDLRGGAVVKNLRLVGNATNLPDGISLNETADGVPTTALIIESVHIGSITGDSGSGSATPQVRYGIKVEGTNNNNSEVLWRNIKIDGCSTAGLRVGGTQYVNHYFEGLWISNCVIGIQNAGQIRGTNWVFAGNTTADLQIPLTDDGGNGTITQTTVHGYFSEGAGRLADFPGWGTLAIWGGSFSGASVNADGKIIKTGTASYQTLDVRDFDFAGTASQFIEFREPNATASAKSFICENCSFDGMTGGPGGQPIDVTLGDPSAKRYVRIVQKNSNVATATPPVVQNVLTGTIGLAYNPDAYYVYRDLHVGQSMHVTAYAHVGATAFQVHAVTIVSDGTTNANAEILTGIYPVQRVECRDPQGCTIRLREAGWESGAVLRLVNIGPNSILMDDHATAGTRQHTAGAFTGAAHATAQFIFMRDTSGSTGWYELSRSNN